MSPKSHPSPDPKRGVSRRLEHVRESEGLTLKDFWRGLRDEGDLELSYVAARNYHYNREPPLSYVVAVSRVYGVSLDWLATGRGDPEELRPPDADVEAVEQRRDRIYRALSTGFFGREEGDAPAFGHPAFGLSEHGYSNLVDAWVLARVREFPGPVHDSKEEYEHARAVGKAGAAPIRALGADPAHIPMKDLNDYLTAVASAFRVAHRIAPQED